MTTSASLFASRYGNQAASELESPLNAVLESLLSHRSVRAFLPQSISEETLKLLITAAQSASTSSNLQAWSVVLVQDPERKNTLATLAGNQEHIREAPLLMVWLADLSRYKRLSERYSRPVDALPYLESFLVGCIDAALAAQNTVVAAESLGLGTVYIGGIRNQVEQVSQLLALPPLVFPVFGLVVGHPDPARPAAIRPRLGQKAVVFHEQYSYAPQQEEDEIDSYDSVLQTFQREQQLSQGAWSQQVLTRLRGANALHGRERLTEILHALGFELK